MGISRLEICAYLRVEGSIPLFSAIGSGLNGRRHRLESGWVAALEVRFLSLPQIKWVW